MLGTPIAISLSPNTDISDFWQTLKIIIQPWVWKKGNEIKIIEGWFKNKFNQKEVFSFNSGRSALYALLQAYNVGKGDEVIVQAYTCIAAIEPILWVGAKPIFCDIDQSCNLEVSQIEQLINKKTKAIIVQHTFGIPAQIKKIKEITQKHNLILIEDCALSLGASVDGRLVGSFGDASFFSFGRDKVVSSVFGGLALINSEKNTSFSFARKQLKNIHDKYNFPGYIWILQQLLHPIVFTLILPLYNFFIGKFIIYFLQKIKLLSKPYDKSEFEAIKPTAFPNKYPNALAFLLTKQLEKLDMMNNKRIEFAYYYNRHIKSKKNMIHLPSINKGAIYLRYNILINNSDLITLKAKKQGMLLGNWYKHTIDPKGVNFTAIGYKTGSCPQAEKTAKLSLNLPTYPRLTYNELDKIISLINLWK